jgi:hypothetical protein
MDQNILESHLNRQMERSHGFFWNRLRWDLISGHFPAARPFELVDVGAGPGFLGDFLAQHHPRVEYRFIEPLASLETSLETRFGAAANLRERDSFGSAEYVTLLDVLEHQEDDRAFLAELAAKMAPGSLLLLTVPAMPSLWSEWDVVLGHYRRYTKDSLRAAAAGLPFELEEVSYLFPELLPLGWVRKLRRGADDADDAAAAEFPDLPGWLNEGLYRFGKQSLRLRRRWPAGTSVFAALRRSA